MSSRLAWGLFELAFDPWMAGRVRVHLAGTGRALPRGQRVLLCLNHESWWDGFLARRLQRTLRPRSTFHAVMTESELRRRPFLRALGALGVRRGSTGSVRRLLRALEGLPAEAVVAFFPQGRIRPGGEAPLGFVRGVEGVARALDPATILPVGIRVLPGRTHRVEAYLSVGEPVRAAGPEPVTAALVERAVARELRAIDAHCAHHEERAAEAWPVRGSLARPDPLGAREAPFMTTISRN